MGKEFECNDCEYKWVSRKAEGEPAVCPRCHSDDIEENIDRFNSGNLYGENFFNVREEAGKDKLQYNSILDISSSRIKEVAEICYEIVKDHKDFENIQLSKDFKKIELWTDKKCFSGSPVQEMEVKILPIREKIKLDLVMKENRKWYYFSNNEIKGYANYFGNLIESIYRLLSKEKNKSLKGKHCSNCGSLLKDKYQFCPECGEKIGRN